MSDPFAADLQVRFRDIDAMGHVNNAVYATYLEQARTAYFHEVLEERLDEVSTVLANLELSYERPITLGQAVRVVVRVADLGASSLPMTYEVLADGERAAAGETVQVFVDSEAGESIPIPDRIRERIVAFEGGDPEL
jgi:acyl-CoA thioester hydrolase